MNKQIIISSILLGAGLACSNDVGRPDRRPDPNMMMPTVSSIRVTGESQEMVIGQSLDLTAMATMSDGSTKNVSNEATWNSSSPSIANVSLIGQVTGRTIGRAKITASFSGQSGSLELRVIIDVSKQSLVISPDPAVLEANANQQFMAHLVLADGTMSAITASVTWSSSDDGVIRFDQTNPTGLGTAGMSAGTATITATDSNSGLSAQASVIVTAAQLASLEISPARSRIPLGSSGQFTVEGVYSDGMRADLTAMVEWSSSLSTTASISNAPGQAGHVETHAIGNTSITATHIDSGISATVTLTVTNPTVLLVKVSPNTAMVGVGRNQRFRAAAVYTDHSEIDVSRLVTWSSSNSRIASISNQSTTVGTANGLTVGTTTISALHRGSGVSSDDSQDSATLIVLPATLTSIAVTPLQTTIALGANQIYLATGIYSNGSNQNISAQVVWRSADPSVATVSTGTTAPGIAQSIGQGTTTISVIDPATGISSTDSMRSAELTVLPPELVSIEVRPSIANMVVMGRQQFTAIAHYSNGSQANVTNSIIWGSTNSNVVSIDRTGMATGNSLGMATISAQDSSARIGSDDSNQSARVTVTLANLTSISITPTSTIVPVGVTTSFTATGNYDNGSSNDMTELVDWQSSDTAIASVSNQSGTRGQVTTTNVGMTTISARDPSTGIDSNSSGVSATVNVTQLTLQLLNITPTMPAAVRVGRTLQFLGTGTFSDGSVHDVSSSVQWTSSNASVGSISTSTLSGGLFSGLTVGTTNISAQDMTAGITSNLVNVSVTVACNVTDLRISEVHIGDSDYARLVNPTSCTLSLRGLRMRFDDYGHSSPNADVDYNFTNSVSLGPNESLYVCEQSVSNCGDVLSGGFANDVCIGTNIVYAGSPGRSGTTYLCNGDCGVSANIIDLHQFSYLTPASAPNPPGRITFSGGPQSRLSNQSTQSYLRNNNYAGANPNFLQSDWTTGNKSR